MIIIRKNGKIFRTYKTPKTANRYFPSQVNHPVDLPTAILLSAIFGEQVTIWTPQGSVPYTMTLASHEDHDKPYSGEGKLQVIV